MHNVKLLAKRNTPKDNKMIIWTRSYEEGGRDSCCVEVKVEGVPVTTVVRYTQDQT